MLPSHSSAVAPGTRCWRFGQQVGCLNKLSYLSYLTEKKMNDSEAADFFVCGASSHRWGRRGGRTGWQTKEEAEDPTARAHQSERSAWTVTIVTDESSQTIILTYIFWCRLPWWHYPVTTKQCRRSCGVTLRKFAVHHGTTRFAYGTLRREKWRRHWWEMPWQCTTWRK